MKTIFLWDWYDVGLSVRFLLKSQPWAEYKMSIDIQILWLDVWIQVVKRAIVFVPPLIHHDSRETKIITPKHGTK
jgi:hypothetical protein